MIFNIIQLLSIYPDNNILVSLEKRTITIDCIKKLLRQDQLIFYYSAAHIMEADTMSAYDRFTKEELIVNRMRIIDELTDGNFIRMNTNKQIFIENRYGLDAYSMVKDFPSVDQIKKGFQENMTFEQRRMFREVLKIDASRLSSLPPKEAIQYLDERYRTAGIDTTFSGTIELSLGMMKSTGRPISLYDKIAVSFGLLDTVGYFRDKETNKSDFARMWDSSHATYAANFDVFLTNDSRTIKKSEVAYHMLNIPTQIISTNNS